YSVPVEKDRYAAAATWFQYAKEGYPIADMYCQISACLQNIAKYEKSEQPMQHNCLALFDIDRSK
ncbi:MAG: hypothetical protein II091_02885, partial [Lachnospiraceae bacterium]|nr:hypothetical protein [Lachnospiraceae bacterium]